MPVIVLNVMTVLPKQSFYMHPVMCFLFTHIFQSCWLSFQVGLFVMGSLAAAVRWMFWSLMHAAACAA